MIVVVSTAFSAPTEARCRDSVMAQRIAPGAVWKHIYVDAAKQTPPKRATENLYDAVHARDPQDVIVCLDGDDWLANDGALARIQREYDRHPECLVTWGSYEHADGRKGCAGRWPKDHLFRDGVDYLATRVELSPRRAPWVFSHLKTFRAGLFQRIAREDLQLDGEWLHRCVDMAVMFPLLEMAGPDRARFIRDILAIYNYASSFEFNAPDAERRVEIEYARILRSRLPYERIESL